MAISKMILAKDEHRPRLKELLELQQARLEAPAQSRVVSRDELMKQKLYTTEKFGRSTEPEASFSMWATSARQVALEWGNTTDGDIQVLLDGEVIISGYVEDGKVFASY